MIVRLIQIRLGHCGKIKRIPGIVKLDNQPARTPGERYGDENTTIEITCVRMIDDIRTCLVRRKLQIVANRLTLIYILDARQQPRDARAKNIQILMGCR
jgi:hypothetical protein